MSLASLNPTQIAEDHRRLDELCAAIAHGADPQLDLLREHLQCAGAYLLGAMPAEYQASLSDARSITSRISDRPLRQELDQALDFLLGQSGHLDRLRASGWHQSDQSIHEPPPEGARSPLWDVFDLSDMTLGTFYPKRHLIAAFASMGPARAAETTLHEIGFGDREARAIPGREMRQLMQELHAQAGLWGEVMSRLSRALGTEQVFVDHDNRLAHEGAAFLAVYCPNESEAGRIRDLLMRFDPISMRRYLTGGIQSLI